VAAEDVAAPLPVPHFSRAAMDGYVCHDADVRDASPERPALLRVTGVIAMGTPPGPGPDRGEAWAITTGGPLPPRGDRVLPLEAARRAGEILRVERPVTGKRNVAPAGEDIHAGARLVAAGDVIAASAAGALVASGVREVGVHRRLRVGLVATGTELVDAALAALAVGRVVNSNSVTLRGALEAMGCVVEYRGIVPDDPEELHAALGALPQRYDAVISTGGVSVGRHDAVHRTWLDLGARRIVGRVDLHPGGPFFAGRIADHWVIGLSGTPVACLAAFHLLVRPTLRRLQGWRLAVRPVRAARLAAALAQPVPRLRALWARVREPDAGALEVDILDGKTAGNYASLIGANGLALVTAGTPPLAAGSRVPVLLLDREEDRNRLTISPPEPAPTVIGITGASGSGKTTVLTGLLRRLASGGTRVVAVKHAAHGFTVDRPGSDSARFADAGAALVVLAGPEETVLRIAAPAADPGRVAQLAADACAAAWDARPDLILVEGFQQRGRPVIQVGEQKPGAGADEVWATVPAVTGLEPAQLDAEIERLAGVVRAHLAGA